MSTTTALATTTIAESTALIDSSTNNGNDGFPNDLLLGKLKPMVSQQKSNSNYATSISLPLFTAAGTTTANYIASNNGSGGDVGQQQQLLQLPTILSSLLPLTQDFNICQTIDISLQTYFDHNMPSDYNHMIFPSSTISKGIFSSIVLKTLHKAQLPEASSNIVLEMLRAVFPGANLPIKITEGGLVTNQLEDYYDSRARKQFLAFDSCPCGETIYVGCHRFRSRCRIEDCNLLRYQTQCRVCRSKDLCNHINRRTPAMSIHYRPISHVIQELLQYNRFHDCLAFTSLDRIESHVSDVLDGPVATQHIHEMKEIWNSFKQSDKYDSSSEIFPINLLFSVGFDGAQLYKSKVSNFYPLVFSILNLPPAIRKVNLIFYFPLKINYYNYIIRRWVSERSYCLQFYIKKDRLPRHFCLTTA